MTTTIMAEMECFEMGRDELGELFRYLKDISAAVEALKENFSDLKDRFAELKQQVAVMEVNIDNTNSKISDIMPSIKEKCKKHEDEIRAATKFIEAHDTKEKTLFGIRADVIAWISLIGLFLAMGANYIKITEVKVKTERQVQNNGELH